MIQDLHMNKMDSKYVFQICLEFGIANGFTLAPCSSCNNFEMHSRTTRMEILFEEDSGLWQVVQKQNANGEKTGLRKSISTHEELVNYLSQAKSLDIKSNCIMSDSKPLDMHSDIAAIFTKYLPSVSSTFASAFANGLIAYHKAFRDHQDKSVNYETLPDYQNAILEIMVVQKDETWIHSPQFRKIMALSIGKLFGTKITRFSPPSNVDIFYTMVFLDSHHNRWLISLQQSEVNQEKTCLCASLPRSGTFMTELLVMNTENDQSSPEFQKNGFKVLVQDTTSIWHD